MLELKNICFTRDGKSVEIFKNGDWAEEFANISV